MVLLDRSNEHKQLLSLMTDKGFREDEAKKRGDIYHVLIFSAVA